MNAIRRRAALVAATALAALIGLGLAAAPATAAPAAESRDQVCWIDADTDAQQCFGSEAAFEAAVEVQTGTDVVREGEVAARSSSGVTLLATYVIAEFYTGTSYSGTKYNITSTSNTICTTGAGKQGNFGAGPNNNIESSKTYYSCVGRVFDGANQTGSYSILYTSITTFGALNNLGSSYILI